MTKLFGTCITSFKNCLELKRKLKFCHQNKILFSIKPPIHKMNQSVETRYKMTWVRMGFEQDNDQTSYEIIMVDHVSKQKNLRYIRRRNAAFCGVSSVLGYTICICPINRALGLYELSSLIGKSGRKDMLPRSLLAILMMQNSAPRDRSV